MSIEWLAKIFFLYIGVCCIHRTGLAEFENLKEIFLPLRGGTCGEAARGVSRSAGGRRGSSCRGAGHDLGKKFLLIENLFFDF